jgi:hypothetical protein
MQSPFPLIPKPILKKLYAAVILSMTYEAETERCYIWYTGGAIEARPIFHQVPDHHERVSTVVFSRKFRADCQSAFGDPSKEGLLRCWR